METNGSFPDDLVSEILSWLPVRQLLRFRCVSKSWRAIVDHNPTFINKHHHRQYAILKKEQGHIPIFLHDIRASFKWYLDLSYSSEDLATRLHFVSKTYDDVHFLELEGFSSRSNDSMSNDFSLNAVPVECIGYANGVFLFEWHIRLMYYSYLGLWNPATQEFKFVPGSCREYLCGESALGFDSMSNDFKIIQLISRVTEGTRVYYACEMYSLKTNSWKSIEYPSHPEHNLLFGPVHSGVHINSIYYWPYSTIHHRQVPQSQESNFILSFDFCNEIFQFLTQPRVEGKYHCFLANYNGSLAFISYPGRNILWDIWVMSKVDDHGIPSAWQHLFAIEPFPGKFGCFCSLWVGSDMLLTLADVPVPNNDDPYGSDDEAPLFYSYLYDPAAKRITKRFEFVLRDRYNYEYVESLWKLTNSTKSI